MTIDAWRWVLFALTFVGAGITVWGLVSAYRGARREYEAAGKRLDMMTELGEAESAESEKAKDEEQRRVSAGVKDVVAFNAETAKSAAERHARWDVEYAKYDLLRPTYENLVYLATYEAKRLLGLVLNSTRRDFLWAGVGLVISTLASAGSLLLT